MEKIKITLLKTVPAIAESTEQIEHELEVPTYFLSRSIRQMSKTQCLITPVEKEDPETGIINLENITLMYLDGGKNNIHFTKQYNISGNAVTGLVFSNGKYMAGNLNAAWLDYIVSKEEFMKAYNLYLKERAEFNIFNGIKFK